LSQPGKAGRERVLSIVDTAEALLAPLSVSSTFTGRINRELRRIWELATGFDPRAASRIAEIERKISNLVDAVEKGFSAEQAQARLNELTLERESLGKKAVSTGVAPQIDTELVKKYLQDLALVFEGGLLTECKQLIRTCVEEISLDPGAYRVGIKFKTPGHAVPALSHSLVAGARYKTLRQLMLPVYQRKWTPPRAGRHSFQAYV
jgi:hypothetical protein